MSRNSASVDQFDFEWSSPDNKFTTSSTPRAPSRNSAVLSTSKPASSSPILSGFDNSSPYADVARIAGRRNAASVSEQEEHELLVERRQLLDKKFEGGLSKREENRLNYVRWSLDRIEDARHGYVLDALESATERYEAFAREVAKLNEEIASAIKRNR